MLFNPQPWAEDGTIFIQQGIFGGWKSIIIPYAGYFHVIPRLVTLLAIHAGLQVSQNLSLVPLFMNLAAIAISGFCISFVANPRFTWLAPIPYRVLIALLVVGMPGIYETLGNITNIQWFLGYYLCLVVWDLFITDSTPGLLGMLATVFACLSSPVGMMFVVLYLLVYFNRLRSSGATPSNLLDYVRHFKKKYLSQMIYIVILILANVAQAWTIVHGTRGFVKGTSQFALALSFGLKVLLGGIFARLLIPNFASFVNYLGFSIPVLVGTLYVSLIFNTKFTLETSGRGRNLLFVPSIYAVAVLFLTYVGSKSWFELYRIPFGDGGGRYLVIPMSIVLTLTVAALNRRVTFFVKDFQSGVKFRKLLSKHMGTVGLAVLLLLVLRTEIFNFKVPAFVDYHWHLSTKAYQANGKDVQKVPINPPGWNIVIPK